MLVQAQTTASGVTFAHLPYQAASPAPTLLLFTMSGVDTLSVEPYCRVGHGLHAEGWNVVSLDLPCHGQDQRAGEPKQLEGWAARTRQGEDFVAPFQKRVNEVIRELIDTRIADPARIAAAGTSRGGFMAFQAALGNPDIRAVVAFAPVTDLRALSEFKGQADNPLVQRLALLPHAKHLAERATWIIIGNADDRVDSAKAMAFADALAAAKPTPQLRGDTRFRLTTTAGHTTLPEWHDEAAQWLLETVAALPPKPQPHPSANP